MELPSHRFLVVVGSGGVGKTTLAAALGLGAARQEQDTLVMTFDQGWQISFRIHSASTMIEPSLEFDINLVGLPTAMSRHVIDYRSADSFHTTQIWGSER